MCVGGEHSVSRTAAEVGGEARPDKPHSRLCDAMVGVSLCAPDFCHMYPEAYLYWC